MEALVFHDSGSRQSGVTPGGSGSGSRSDSGFGFVLGLGFGSGFSFSPLHLRVHTPGFILRLYILRHCGVCFHHPLLFLDGLNFGLAASSITACVIHGLAFETSEIHNRRGKFIAIEPYVRHGLMY